MFSKKVISAYERYDFESLFIIGPQGMGKTTYAMLVLYEIYRDWDLVLHYLVFDPREILPELKSALVTGKRLRLVVFDDAGIHLSKYLWVIDKESQQVAMLINGLFNIIRTVVSGVVFTSPDMDVLKELRKKSWWIGEPKAPSGKSKPYRQMVLFRKRIMVTGQVRVSRKAIDEYDLRLIPADVRREYEEKRKNAMLPVIEKLQEIMGSPHPPQGARKLAEHLQLV